MTDALTIYLARLEGGKQEKLDASLPLEGEDADPVAVSGQAYVVGDELILHLWLKSQIRVPCRVCNGPVPVDIDLQGVYATEDLTAHKGATVDAAPIVRELVLLEVPPFAECEGGCKGREELNKYLHKGSEYHPFEGLKKEE